MAQTPHQQIHVVQQQPVSSAQLQQLYFPQQQMVFPGNIPLQQAAAAGQHTLQAITPNRTYSTAPVGLLPKAIQPVHSIAGSPRLMAAQMTTQAAGFQPTNFLGSFTTLGSLPVGYQWATNCYQPNPIIIRSPHPNIYVQQPPTLQLPISAAQQIVTPTSFATNPHIQQETQTIATQTLVPSVTAVNSANSYVQIQDPNNPPVTKPSPSPSPSSTTEAQIQNQQSPMLLSTQSVTQHVLEEPTGILSSVTEVTEVQSAEIESEFATLEETVTSSPQKPELAPGELLANTDSSCTTGVSSTTPTAPVGQLYPYLSSLGKRTMAMVDTSSEEPPSFEIVSLSNEMDKLVEAEEMKESNEEPPAKVDAFSPQTPIKHAYLRPLKEKQPQKAIVKPQMLSHVQEAPVEKEEETYLSSSFL